jgi:flagellar motor switch protein FliM
MGDNGAAPALLGHLDSDATSVVDDLLRASAPRIRRQMVNRVGMDLPIVSVDSEWAPMSSVLDRMAPSVAVASCRIDPPGMDVLVAVESELLYRLVGLVLGASPASSTTPGGPDRIPSRFDLVIARRITEDVLAGIVVGLPGEEDRKVLIDEVGTSTRMGLGLSRSAFVCAASFDLETPDRQVGRITVVLPSSIARIGVPRKSARAHEGKVGMGRVLPLSVTLVAELRRVSLPFSRLQGLQPGQVLDLGPSKDVVLRVGERPTLVAEAGIQNTMRSVKVKGRVT